MERLTTPLRDLRQRPGYPSPAGSAATEDEGQRSMRTTSEAKLSDIDPAGRLLYPSENEPDTPSSAGRDRAERGTEDQAPTAELQYDTQVNTGRAEAESTVPADGPVERRNCRRREVSLDVRLTVADREAIRHRAGVLGVKPSAWARAVMLDALDARSEKVVRLESSAVSVGVSETVGPAVEQLRRVGVNLNQALRNGAAVDGDLLRAVMGAVNELRAALGDRTRT